MRSKAKSTISSLTTVRTFLKSTCSEALCNVLDRAYGHPLKIEEQAALPLAGGIMQHGYQCGLVWGATLAAGAQAYQLYGSSPQAEVRTIMVAQKLVEAFRAANNSIDCYDLTDIDESSSTKKMINYFLLKGGTVKCLRMAAKYASLALCEINAAFSAEPIEAPQPPVSCAAILAQKMGMSDRHAVMAAGLAGGIGLCGGACGALGAAIWILSMKSGKGGGKVEYKSAQAQETIDRFVKSSGYEFECAKIVGKKFTNVADHADYIRHGGCAKIIDVLARV